MTKEQVQELVDRTKELETFQETPSSKEELEAIKLLTREDIRKKTYLCTTPYTKAERPHFCTTMCLPTASAI